MGTSDAVPTAVRDGETGRRCALHLVEPGPTGGSRRARSCCTRPHRRAVDAGEE